MTLNIYSENKLVRNSASLDLEWLPYLGIYTHEKTKIMIALKTCSIWIYAGGYKYIQSRLQFFKSSSCYLLKPSADIIPF
jgi:hypothetical protein